jgi:DnaK suppressor protein
VAVTIALVGWMGKVAQAGAATPQVGEAAATVVRRVVVVASQPAPEPYISLEAAPASRTVVVVSQPGRVVHRSSGAPAAPAAAAAAVAPVTAPTTAPVTAPTTAPVTAPVVRSAPAPAPQPAPAPVTTSSGS